MAGKGLPPSGGGIDPRIKALLDKMSERVDVLSNHRGDPLDRALTPRDLLDLGLARRIGSAFGRIISGGNFIPTTGPGSSAIPPAPSNFEVRGGLSHIFLTWDNARQAYSNHGYTAIFRNTEDNIANAIEVAQSTSSFNFADMDVHFGTSYYYWVRFVSTANIMGPPNSAVGTLGKVSEDPAELLARLSGEISATHLSQSLRTHIESISDEIAELEELFGTTVDAAEAAALSAASATSAIFAETAALQAKNEALVAAGDALEKAAEANSSATSAATSLSNATVKANEAATSATSSAGSSASASSSATTASNSATAAGNSASAAATSSTNAATSATNAGTSASAANQSKLDAQTALSGAQSAETASVAAKSTAEGAAAAAATSATTAVNAKNDAAGSASAASTSETNAASSATAAGTSASVANTSKLAAQSAEGNASTSETNAATSATNAAGSASSASSSATLAATSATNAGNSATAAAGSASTATTKATDASNSADAANTAKVSAESARDTAAGSASASATSASTASTQASNASTSASSANTSATTATTKASEALTYRDQAASSATDAEGYATASAIDYNAVTARLNDVGGLTIEQVFSAQADSITGLYGQYTLKIDVNGRVSGFGLASTGTASTFIINADKFALGKPGATDEDIYPFIVDTLTGNVVMVGAFIQNATITDAQIGDVTVEKITGLNASFILTTMGTAWIDEAHIIDAAITSAKILDASITSAKIAATIQSDNFDPGEDGWRIKRDGSAEFNGVVISRANVVATSTLTPASGYQFEKGLVGGSNPGYPFIWIGKIVTEYHYDDAAGTYVERINYTPADMDDFYREFIIDTGYDNSESISNVSSASFVARARVTASSIIYNPPTFSSGTLTYYFSTDCSVEFRELFSIGGGGTPGPGSSARRIFIRVRVNVYSINSQIEQIRVGAIEWALHRLT